MIYLPAWKINWWEYCPWIIHQYLELALKAIQNDELDRDAKVKLLEVLATYSANYVRRDYEEADYIWSELDKVYKPQYPIGTNIRYYLDLIQSMCELIIVENRPKDDYPDTYRY